MKDSERVADSNTPQNSVAKTTEQRHEQTCPYVVGRTTLHCSLTPLTLTADERTAIREACDEGRWYPKDYRHIYTLRSLLNRTKPVGK